jgi:aminoglycoside phosphotransferase
MGIADRWSEIAVATWSTDRNDEPGAGRWVAVLAAGKYPYLSTGVRRLPWMSRLG